MKIVSLLQTTLPVISTLFIFTFLSAIAFSQQHTRLGLPQNAKARFGKGKINQVKYFPDGKRLAVATSIGTWIYDIQTEKVLDLLTGHTAPVKTIAFSPDGETFATGIEDKTIRLWYSKTYKLKAICIGHEKDVNLLAFSRDSKMLASTSKDWKMRLWDARTGKSLQTITECGADDMYAIAYSPDGETYLTFRYDDKFEAYIEFWDRQTGEFLKSVLIETNFKAAAFSSDCKILAVIGNNTPPLQFWDVESGKLLKSAEKCNESYESIEFSPDGRSVVTGGVWESVSLWEVSKAERLKSMAHGKPINSVAYSPDGKTVASGIDDGTIRFWDVATGKLLNTITGHTDSQIYSVAYSPDGSMLACGGESEIQCWNPQTGKQLKTIKERSKVYSIRFSPDGNIFATGGTSKKARLWDTKTGRFLGRFSAHIDKTHISNNEKISSLAFSPEGNVLATGGSDNRVCLWEILTDELYLIGERLAEFTEHTENVSAVAFSPDGKVLASGSQDKTIQMWDIKTYTHLKTLTGHEEGITAVVYSPDGNTLASGSEDGTIRLWNANKGELVLPPIEEAGQVTSIAFSPDGGTFASGTKNDNVVHLWNAQTRERLQTFTGHTERVNAVVYSSDGDTLASVSSDGTILLWDLTKLVSDQ